MANNRVRSTLINICMALCMLLLGDCLGGQLAFGSYVGALYTGNMWVVSLMYIASSAVHGTENLINSGVQVAVMLAVIMLSKAINKRINVGVLLIAILLANTYYLVSNYSVSSLLNNVSHVACAVIFSIVSVYSYRCLFVRTLAYKPALDENICLCLQYMVLCYSISTFSVSVFMPICLVVPLVVAISASVMDNQVTLVLSSLGGLATVIATGQYPLLAVYVAMGIVAVATCRYSRYVMALLIIALDVVMAYLINSYMVFNIYVLLPTIIAMTIYIIVPTNTLKYYSDVMHIDGQYSCRAVINRMRGNTANKLYRLSDIFLTIKNNLIEMTKGSQDGVTIIHNLTNAVNSDVCVNCINRKVCWRNNIKDTEKAVMALCRCAVDKGSATILDVSPTFTSSCNKLPAVLSYINGKAHGYANDMLLSRASVNSKLLLAEQLGGVSQLLAKLAESSRDKVSFDSDKEKLIIESLTFRNIMTAQAIYIEHSNSINIILTISQSDLDNSSICSIVSSIVGYQMYVERVENSSQCWATVYLAVEPQYSITLGLRAAPKHGSQVSGDVHSFVSIGEGKYMLAICDGMGSGQDAETMSNISITLVENLYRAGLDNDVIISCVNRLMTGCSSESYSTADICVVDLYNGLCDFIKLGASKAIVRSGSTVSYVAGQNLPLGVIEAIKPVVTKKTLVSGDIIMLASDGIWDCYEHDSQLADVVSGSVATNPQLLADNIMQSAMNRCKGRAIDDMTVIVARIV